MCRLLSVRAAAPFAIAPHLAALARIARNSREYQGHGWGCAWLEDGQWRTHHDIRPIWEDPREGFGETTLLVAHARSAFRNEGIAVENNMPFCDGTLAFAFNGELRGVRIAERGRIGAEKILNYVKRLDRGDTLAALRKATSIIERRSRHVRAMNIVLASRTACYLVCRFDDDPDYFQMQERHVDGLHAVSSEPYGVATDWVPVPNGTVKSW